MGIPGGEGFFSFHWHIFNPRCQLGIPTFKRVEGANLERLRPHSPEHTRSCLILESKQGQAWLVFGWETEGFWLAFFSSQGASLAFPSSRRLGGSNDEHLWKHHLYRIQSHLILVSKPGSGLLIFFLCTFFTINTVYGLFGLLSFFLSVK